MLVSLVKKQTAVICLSLFTCFNAQAATSTESKTILITNGTTGVGKEIALTFQKANWNVWATCDNPQSCTQIPGINVEPINSANQRTIKQLAQKIQAKSKRLDVIVNNSVYNIVGPEEAISAAQAQEMFNTNIITPLVVIQECLPLMRSTHSGHIITISNTPGTRALPGLGLYTASHMALEGLSEALATELTPWKIKVSIIESGAVDAAWAKNAPNAANLDSHPGYKNFNQNLRTDLTKKSTEKTVPAQQIADLVLQIANTDKPNMRYQTDGSAISIVSQLFNDPTGNINRDKMISLSKDLYDLPATF